LGNRLWFEIIIRWLSVYVMFDNGMRPATLKCVKTDNDMRPATLKCVKTDEAY